ncbi:DUF2264 domain-containing protein [Nonomuraea sp. K274]|uniref:DUF2264 domain-containing protein n=1 Tax=Nonomuraea cypriaca TaxID=1187855 RepID=A0A931AJE4_9ACTN|nr:DUF2264 domain-containing protein [Nonomuraea cypriaca]MBF8193981.1 DUF2264 domain-containing protein [Nonomuraea cypriaca]
MSRDDREDGVTMALPNWLPPEDRRRSPFTGWTRAHWETVADHWLLPLRDHASPGHALITPPGRPSHSGIHSDGLEGFARSFVLAASRIATGDDPHDHAGFYAEGLRNGTSAHAPDAWPRGRGIGETGPGNGQPIVEAAVLALALHLSRAVIWDALDDDVRDRAADWLRHHAQRRAPRSNWLLFPAAAEAFLRSVGADTDGCANAERVAELEEWYAGDGWYTDGDGRHVDHYNAYVIHPLLGLWYRLTGDDAGLARWRQRLAEFVARYAPLFAPDGAPMYQGRSLTYRPAVLAPLWTAVAEGVSPLAPGASRRLASGTLRYFVNAGVGATGPLTLGWYAAEHLPSVQRYSGPGSPYYAGLGFLGLALPADHPEWTAAESPQPSDAGTPTLALPSVGWLVHGHDGIVRLANHGSDHQPAQPPPDSDVDDPQYTRFGYSTHTTPGLGRAAVEGIDNHVALLDAAGRPSRRGPIRGHTVGDGYAASWHVPQRDGRPVGTRIVTASMVDGPWELRCHLVDGPAGPLREGGHLLTGVEPLRAHTGTAVEAATAEVDAVAEVERADGLYAAVIGLHGYDASGVARYDDVSAMGRWSAVPYLLATRQDGPTVHVAAHLLARSVRPAEWPSAVTVKVHDTVVMVTWASGRTRSVDLATLFVDDAGLC